MRASEVVQAVRTHLTSGSPDADIREATFSDEYRHANSGAAGIRVAHAQAALNDPDSVEVFHKDDGMRVCTW